VISLGTWQTLDVADDKKQRAEIDDVCAFLDGGRA
jgi:hypothetical protein